MAFASVAVCVVVADGQPVREAVAAAMAPFDMAKDPNGRWDRWRIDGARDKRLPVRAGCEDDPRLVRVSKPPEEWDRGRCDGAPRGLLDFSADRAAARLRAERVWAEWHETASAYPVGQPIDKFLGRHLSGEAGYTLRAARREHMEQPVMRAYLARHGLDPDRVIFDGSDPISRLGYDLDDYVRKRVARVAPSDELLRLDGVWMEYSDFGADQDESQRIGPLWDSDVAWDAYYAAADAYLEALPAPVYIVQVMIHS